ncbi:putative ribokinase [Ochromonadaceae sp. CCMP2298]|nr:putative ribokinase [Ochromonadaceae sp. CCMP2298]
MSAPEIVIVGSTMMDLVTYADVLPKVGETIFGTSFVTSFGGKGANQAVQVARLGVRSCMVGAVGTDANGDAYMAQLSAEGVDTTAMRRGLRSTGTASIQVDAKGQNTILIVQGANLDLLPEHVETGAVGGVEGLIAQAGVVLCQNEIPLQTTLAALRLCRLHQTVSILNPAPAPSHESAAQLVPLCDIVCPNETELAAMTGLPAGSDAEVVEASRVLLLMGRAGSGGLRCVVVTLGARGACLTTPSSTSTQSRFFSTSSVDAVDTVGAGDSFIGSFACSLARGCSLEDAIHLALHCASLSVTRKGAQVSYPRLTDLDPSLHPPSTCVDKRTISAALNL